MYSKALTDIEYVRVGDSWFETGPPSRQSQLQVHPGPIRDQRDGREGQSMVHGTFKHHA